MPKIPIRLFRLPTLVLTGHPFRRDEDDKLWWVNFQFDGDEFPLDELGVLETGRLLKAKNVAQTPEGKRQFQFKGIPEKVLVPQTVLYPNSWPVRQERKAYLVPLGAQNQRIGSEKGTLKSGILGDKVADVDVKKLDGPDDKYLIVVSCQKRFPCLVGQLYTVELADGTSVDTALVTCGTVEPRDLADFVKKTFRFPGLPSVNALYSINLRVMGWTILPQPLWDEEFEETEGTKAVRVMTKAFAHFRKKMRNAAAQPGGIDKGELFDKMALPDAVFVFLVERAIEDEVLKEKDGYLLPVADPTTYLSPIAQKALQQLDEAGSLGIDLPNVSNDLFRRTYEQLVRMGLAVVTETPFVYSHTGWTQVKTKLCGTGTLGKEWKIADVKELLQTSRKPILGILNKLEEEGFLERKEDHRLVVNEIGPSAST